MVLIGNSGDERRAMLNNEADEVAVVPDAAERRKNGGGSSATANSINNNNGMSAAMSAASVGQQESSGSDDDREGRIRVGKDYQANPPNWIPPQQRRSEQCPERALLVWSPNANLPQTKLDEYIQVSKEKYGYNAEQALGMLFWHKHDLDRAMQDLANFTPFPDEWTVEDKVLFEQAFQFHGKSFHRIRQMLPDKSIAQLVKYYYGWKKTRTRTSLMDRQARKLQVQREQQVQQYSGAGTATAAASASSAAANASSEGSGGEAASSDATSAASGGPPSSSSAAAAAATVKDEPSKSSSALASGAADVLSDDDDREESGSLGQASGNASSSAMFKSKPKCFNCGIMCHVTHATPKGQMCGTCHQYYQRTGHVRPTTGPARRDGKAGQKYSGANILRNHSRPPKGMYINHDDLVALATGPNTQGEQLLKSMDREIVSYKRIVQSNKQVLSGYAEKTRNRKNIGPYRPPDPSSKINARWTNEELLLGVQGVRKFGKNFKVIAEVIGTKTESHVRSFYVNYRRRYNLDAALKEYEAEHGPTPNDDLDVVVSTPSAETTTTNGKIGSDSSRTGSPKTTEKTEQPTTTNNHLYTGSSSNSEKMDAAPISAGQA